MRSTTLTTMAGRSGDTMPCGWCQEPQTARTMRLHFSTCPKKPKRLVAASKRMRAFATNTKEKL